MKWYIVITEEMREAGLTGNDLLVFAAIHGFSQRGEGCYFGSASYLAELCGVTKRAMLKILKRLSDGGYLMKQDVFRNGVHYCAYQTRVKSSPVVNKVHGGGEQSSPNNKEDKTCINTSTLSSTRTREKKIEFVPPTVEEVRAYCEERGNGVDAEAFVAFYQSKGWKVGTSPMKDWRASVVTWEKREAAEAAQPRTPRREKESYVEAGIRMLDKIDGTNFHDTYYNKEGKR